jgi:hypothetical protein
LPLVAQRLAGDLRTLKKGITNMTSESRYVPCKLDRNASDEPARAANITAASGEEEAGTQALLCMTPVSYRACNRCFASTSQPAQPEDVLLALAIGPFVYPVQEIDASFGEARRLVLRGVRVERRVLGVWKAGDKVLCSLTMSAERPILLRLGR